MEGVTIFDYDHKTGVLLFDLHDILELLGDDVLRSAWRVQDVECVGGEAAYKLHSISEKSGTVEGVKLARLAQAIEQTIDGEFAAYLPMESVPWIIIRAVDSSAFDVLTIRHEVISLIKSKFRRVEILKT